MVLIVLANTGDSLVRLHQTEWTRMLRACSLAAQTHHGPDAILAFAQLGLARAYALEKDEVHSRVAYQDLLALWKDADPDLPVLKQAKAEYDKVKVSS